MRYWSYCEATRGALAPFSLYFLPVVNQFYREESPVGMERKVTKQKDDVCWQLKEDEERENCSSQSHQIVMLHLQSREVLPSFQSAVAAHFFFFQ